MSNLSGVIPAIPTPLLGNEDADIKSLKKLIDFVIEKGVSGIFVLGSMGEGPALIDSQKKAVVETAVKHTEKRVPVLAGVSEVSTRRAIELAKVLEQLTLTISFLHHHIIMHSHTLKAF